MDDLEVLEDSPQTKLCFNLTSFDAYIKGLIKNATKDDEVSGENFEVEEGDPLVYIVAVLLFYSCGIAVLMINYMKKEQNEEAETTRYKEYIERHSRCNSLNSSGATHGAGARAGGLNRLALTALNAVNVIAQDSDSTGARVAFV